MTKKRSSDSSPSPQPQDIDAVLRDWPLTSADVQCRLITAGTGRKVLQMRIDMGLLQLETSGRPDGSRPYGKRTYYDHLVSRALKQGQKFHLHSRDCREIDREFLQYYHRRLCWLHLRRFSRASRDAEHTLSLMNFARAHSPNEDWTLAHEQYRPFVMFHHAQARALAALGRGDSESAVELLNDSLSALHLVFEEQQDDAIFEEHEFLGHLRGMRDCIRESFSVGPTLNEQLKAAVDMEDYELAAKIRDQLANRADRKPM